MCKLLCFVPVGDATCRDPRPIEGRQPASIRNLELGLHSEVLGSNPENRQCTPQTVRLNLEISGQTLNNRVNLYGCLIDGSQ